jgi:proteasome accessory factor B
VSTSRIHRLLRLITLLQGRQGYTADDLARELEVSRRTIFRDLNMLEMAHIPYYFDREAGGYRISRHFFLPPVNLTLPETLSVLLLTGRLRGGRNVPLIEHGARAAMKFESVLPASLAEGLGSVIDRLHVYLPPNSPHDGEDAFDELARAVAEHRVCRMQYESFYEGRTIDVEFWPLRLIFRGRGWYLLARTAEEPEPRTYKVVRIGDLEVTERHFDARADVEPAEHFGDAWNMIPEGEIHDVHLRFEPRVAGNVAEVRWHHSQETRFNDDGTMEFFARVDGLGEIGWWILGYGDQVEVLAPLELRRRVAETASRAAARNGAEGGSRP